MKNIICYLGLVVLLLNANNILGQNVLNVLPVPTCFKELKYDPSAEKYFYNNNPYGNYWEMEMKKDVVKNNRWNVFTTRSNTPVYDQPNGSVVKNLDFSSVFFVNKVSDGGEFIEIISDYEGPVGWCNTKDMILWQYPLVDPATRIELKAFTVNNLSRLEHLKLIKENKELYQIYDGPGTDANKLTPRLIYDVFFVYKYVNESKDQNGNPIPGMGRFLVSEHPRLGPTNKLLGWIDEGRTRLWKTALSLEPNFDQAALKERAEKGIISTVYTTQFGSADQLENYRKTGEKGEALVGGVLRDPSLGDYKLNDRMDGEIFRYPVFRAYSDPENSRIITAVTGKTNLGNSGLIEGFDDDVYTQINKKRKDVAENMQFKNIIFLLDGSEGTKEYHKVVQKYLGRAFNKNVANSVNTIKYGAVLYKNDKRDEGFSTNPESDFIKVYPKSTEANRLAEELGRYHVSEAGTVAQGEAVYYAMKKAIEMLVPNETNIVIHIGNAPDNSVLTRFYRPAKPEMNLSANDLGTLIKDSETDMHYINFIGYTETVYPSTRERFFENQCQDILPELAIAQANKIFGVSFVIDNRKPEAPELKKHHIPGAEVATMTKSAFEMKSYFLDDYNTDEVSGWLVAELDTCDMRTEAFLENLKKVVDDDSALKDRTGDFEWALLARIMDKLMSENVGKEKEILDAQEWFAKSKVQLFVEAETYYKCDKLSYPLFKYVLFMKESKLKDRLSSLDAIINITRSGDEKTTLAAMQNYWVNMAKGLTGGDKLDNTTSKLTISQLRDQVNGIKSEDGIVLPNEIEKFGSLKIGDMEKKRRLTSEEEAAMLKYFIDAHEKLTQILNEKIYYQVVDDGPKYYWVPIEYVFG